MVLHLSDLFSGRYFYPNPNCELIDFEPMENEKTYVDNFLKGVVLLSPVESVIDLIITKNNEINISAIKKFRGELLIKSDTINIFDEVCGENIYKVCNSLKEGLVLKLMDFEKERIKEGFNSFKEVS